MNASSVPFFPHATTANNNCWRLLKFCVVGASGVIVNMGVLIALTEGLGIPFLVSSVVAIEVSILSNFALNNAWTWRDRHTTPLRQRLLKYHGIAAMTAFVKNWGLLILLTRWFQMDYRLANLVGIAAGVALNFSINFAWTFRNPGAGAQTVRRWSISNFFRDPSPDRKLRWIVMIALTALLVAKLYFISGAELLPEEAYYWTYSQHPDLSYFDHPPMVAWIISFGTILWGHTEFGVRFGTILLSLGSSAILFLLVRVWFGTRTAGVSLLLFNLLPIFIATGTVAFPDGPLVFFWLLTMYAVTKAVGATNPEMEEDRLEQELWIDSREAGAVVSPSPHTGWWVLAGIAFGAAMLSKYTAVMLGVSLGLFLLASRDHRHWFRRPQPWLAALVALAFFSPVVIWNAQHEWASFLFQSNRTAGPATPLLKNTSEFWLTQMGMLGPLLFVVLALAAFQTVRRAHQSGEARWLFCASFFFPLFLVFLYASFKTEIHVNWTAPTFLSLLPVAAVLVQEGFAGKSSISPSLWRKAGWITGALTVAMFAFALNAFVWGKSKSLTYSKAGGWRSLARAVQKAESNLKDRTGEMPFVLGLDKYNLAAELSFYTREPENKINTLALGQHGLGFRYWTDLGLFKGRPAVAVLTKLHPATLVSLKAHFDRVDAPQRLDVPSFGCRHRTLWLVRCYGYQGRPDSLTSPDGGAGSGLLPAKPTPIL